ncbi:hypothetical protein BDB00DRAFT_875447 [Zychaea mexicana]|uniref:uncharacterized protein n=1 Tax=Zychaea mexicana TaxID=64656 RepID=UPI0022FDD141|nr:uncharacterized protein BDB00DRAFT_875447 [Zychaea mexicana]KAI9490267.1 hypothetical protein BDB00DRAFT_875447 [Zychaea mexicana]
MPHFIFYKQVVTFSILHFILYILLARSLPVWPDCPYDELVTGRGSIRHLFRALDSRSVKIASFHIRALMPNAPMLESPESYCSWVDLQPFYAHLHINNVPLILVAFKHIASLANSMPLRLLLLIHPFLTSPNLNGAFSGKPVSLQQLERFTDVPFITKYPDVWSQVLKDCLLESVSAGTISKAIFSLDFPSWPLRRSYLSTIQLIASIMLGVWHAY